MLKFIAGVLLLSSSAISLAQNNCDTRPYSRGTSAAESACRTIANTFVPLGSSSCRDPISCEIGTRICSTADTIKCKQAMQDYLTNSSDGQACSVLINQNVELNMGGKTIDAKDFWSEVANDACNQD